jgi:extracellular elastinolytic metalloproteinase
VGAAAGRCPAATHTGRGGFTYGDYGRVHSGPEIHSDGEIWAQTLWDVRAALGSTLAEKLVTRAMQLSPPEPSFLDMRNAILQADVQYDAKAHLAELWSIFANRGMGYFASTSGSADTDPIEDFSTPPSCTVDPCGSIRGKITDSLTGAPVAGVVVAIAGHDTGLSATDLLDRTGADGRYRIDKVPFHRYAALVIDRWGLEPRILRDFTVNGNELVTRTVVRDWAALDGGANIVSFTPPNYTAFGCGPAGALDRSLGSGWGSDAPNATFGSNVTGPRALVVSLPRSIDVASFGVDAAATCGDPPSAGTAAFDIYTQRAGGPWVLAVHVTFGAVTGRLGRYVPTAGTNKVQAVKIVLRRNRGDPVFMDLTELSVRGRA